ncbi:uncharacterized protein VICG_00335 [Vittaforma corneae ATCC 50505]|uniref:Uncharacterized protein n=1 Tax=Vittaforma corneae (strain ATCC 50505) TaxID=993615 RepID=L2GNY6_VITCO|nr:uncharacterized protein VICG_00335 [Vittaforma corneae ATCC 50505]ELA42583.1 hypothetical protein VICG_00335 [Vittaforma corneae ATCC 50505]
MRLPIKKGCIFLYFIKNVVSISSITVPIENILMPDGCSESKKYEFIKELTKVGNDDVISGNYKKGLNPGYPFDSNFSSIFDSSVRCSTNRESNSMKRTPSFDPCRYSPPYSHPSQSQPSPQTFPQSHPIPQSMQQIAPQAQPPGTTTLQPSAQPAIYPIYVPVPIIRTVTVSITSSSQQTQPTTQPSSFGTMPEASQLPGDCSSFRANSYTGGTINCGTTSFNKPQQTANVQQMPYAQYASASNTGNACIPTGNASCQNHPQGIATQTPMKSSKC